MPTHKSAAKRMKTSSEARQRNRGIKSSMRTAIKRAHGEKEAQKKTELVKTAVSIVDKAAGKKIIHKNKAARIKSRLSASLKSR